MSKKADRFQLLRPTPETFEIISEGVHIRVRDLTVEEYDSLEQRELIIPSTMLHCVPDREPGLFIDARYVFPPSTTRKTIPCSTVPTSGTDYTSTSKRGPSEAARTAESDETAG